MPDKNNMFSVKLTPAEKAALRAEAGNLNKSMSNYVLTLLYGDPAFRGRVVAKSASDVTTNTTELSEAHANR